MHSLQMNNYNSSSASVNPESQILIGVSKGNSTPEYDMSLSISV